MVSLDVHKMINTEYSEYVEGILSQIKRMDKLISYLIVIGCQEWKSATLFCRCFIYQDIRLNTEHHLKIVLNYLTI